MSTTAHAAAHGERIRSNWTRLMNTRAGVNKVLAHFLAGGSIADVSGILTGNPENGRFDSGCVHTALFGCRANHPNHWTFYGIVLPEGFAVASLTFGKRDGSRGSSGYRIECNEKPWQYGPARPTRSLAIEDLRPHCGHQAYQSPAAVKEWLAARAAARMDELHALVDIARKIAEGRGGVLPLERVREMAANTRTIREELRIEHGFSTAGEVASVKAAKRDEGISWLDWQMMLGVRA